MEIDNFDAAKARLIVNTRITDETRDVLAKIIESAKEGNTSMTLYDDLAISTIVKLRDKGFRVTEAKIQVGYKYIISW